MMRGSVVLIAATILGCSLEPIVDESPDPTLNECSDDAECGSEGVCIAGACRAHQGRFSTVLFEVTAPTSAQQVAGVQFLQRLDGMSVTGGELALALGHIAHVRGKVIPTRALYQETCGDYGFLTGDDPPGTALAGADASIPAKVTFTPAERFLGLAVTSYMVELPASESKTEYSFELWIPPGDYHVYVQPGEQVPGACAIPPEVFRGQRIEAGDVNLTATLAAPEQLKLSVLWPGCNECGTLDGWTVDVIDPLSGRVISTRVKLSDSVITSNDAREYSVELALSPVGDLMMPGGELIRLSPPEGMAAPVVLLERRVVELFVKGEGIINQFTQLPAVIDVEGQVTVAGSTQGTRALVTLIAKEIDGIGTGTSASYVRTVEADDSGNFHVQLLPGNYRVRAVPAGDFKLAATETEWVIAGMPQKQAGKLIELSESFLITGAVLHPSGSGPIVGANVQAVPSPDPVQVLDRALGAVPFVPRASTGVVDEQGNFEIRADRGIFDVSVQPATSTGFAWLVRPNVVVEGPETTKSLGPAPLPLPLPVAYQGTVTTADTGPLGGALIRAFLYLDGQKTYTTEPESARSLLQIAESRAAADGSFELLIPARSF